MKPEMKTLQLAVEIRTLSKQPHQIRRSDILRLREAARAQVDQHGRATPALQEALLAAEAALRPRFDGPAARAFQTLVAEVGAKMKGPIDVPEIRVPYWLKDPGPLDGFRSCAHVPAHADYVIIGAGLTGASTARNLISEVERGKTAVVLEMGDRPASGASGRNGGNIEMMKESFFKDYRGFVEAQKDFLRDRFGHLLPDKLTEKELQQTAERQSKCLLAFFQKNIEEICSTIQSDKIHADVSMKGWLRIAEDKAEESGLEEEVAFARKTLGMEMEILSKDEIQARTGIPADFKGRFIGKSGNYHPYKFVTGVLSRAVDRGVQLYTGIRVLSLSRLGGGEGCKVHTSDGTIHAAKVIVATNAYTRDLFPEMHFIEPRVSHISDFQHVEDTFDGMTITKKRGDWYANFPGQDRYIDTAGKRRGTLHVGGGLDTPIPPDRVHSLPYLDEVYHEVRTETEQIIPATKDQPPLRSWSGLMAFTQDRAPVLSFLYQTWDGEPDRSVILAVAFNGYGGSQCAISGRTAAQMAITGNTPKGIPDEVFSMRRFLTPNSLPPG